MLDNATKRRIDTARDILVGKVPDPKSQVEQITIALIYKFMDDMDAESEEYEGKRSFFSGEFEKYGWSRLMAPDMGGYDVLNLYSEAIQKMSINPKIPQLFLDIFKNAYLPYRDPETLKSFLKVIDDFEYDHSERLGDAFEYLLSVLGSQGKAGQFRTPRHIIDFMVEVINPGKNDTIIDPACGTAGFLISSYKYIIRQNAKDGKPGAGLTPDERSRLSQNIEGYDISPDMVRLSLVNMYLHGFTDPHIFEYDTLTSEDRWYEFADVILANPPFMSPKGGIKPHKRFSVQSKRSEVLFVDYIAEHLSPSGRAAVIVPEGIIFQSGTAYKKLRKMLVENFLFGVVSLPTGVFNPYSGVKTSILLMDKTLAKKCDSILFVKIENEGTDLGAKRSAVKGSELPTALFELRAFLNNEQIQSKISIPIKKEKILAKKDCNLTMSRYVDSQVIHSFYEPVKLGEYITESKERIKDQSIDVWSVSNQQGFINSKEYFKKDVPSKNLSNYKIINPEYFAYNPSRINVGSLAYNFSNYVGCVSPMYVVFDVDNTKLDNIFLLRMLKSKQFMAYVQENAQGGVRQQLKFSDLCYFQIPLPLIEIQKEIVSEIEVYQKIIDGARQVVENYKPEIQIEPEWEMVDLGNYIEFVSGLTLSIPECEDADGVPIIAINNVKKDGEITLEGLRRIKLPPKKTINYLKKGDLLFNWRNGSKHLVGKTGFFELKGEYVFASFLIGIRTKQKYLFNKYLWYLLNIYRADGKYMQFMRQNVNCLFNREELKILKIPLPDIETQNLIVAQIEKEQELVKSNKELIQIYEQKIKDKIACVWN